MTVAAASDDRRHTEHGRERKQQLLDAAAELFTANGYAATRIEDICRRAGVAKGLFYWYFSTKQELFSELVRTMRRRLRRAQAILGDPRAAAGPFAALLDLKYAEAKEQAVEWFTDAYLQYHLESTHGNITQAAERTGMARPNFSRLMRRFGIEPQKGASAVHELAHQILRINGLQDLTRGITVNVVQVSGGLRSTVIPDYA